MHPAASMTTDSSMCSLVAHGRSLDPIGTAGGGFERHIFVEMPLPWSRNVLDSPGFPNDLVELPDRSKRDGRPARVLAIAPDPVYSVPGHTRVIHLQRPADPFSDFLVDEWVVPNESLDAFAKALNGTPQDLRDFDSYRQDRQGVRDFLICTQGSRDACCGKFGYELFRELRDQAEQFGDGNVRIWRVSHLGGHRFAPTAIELPDVRQWGHVTPEVAKAILSRTGEFKDVGQHYRGWAGLKTPWEQALEREVLEWEGWIAIQYPKSGRVVEVSEDERSARVSLSLDLPDGITKRYEAVVQVAETISAPESCRSDKETDFPCYRVSRIDVDVVGETSQATS